MRTFKLVRDERIDSTGAFSPWKETWVSDHLLSYFNISMKDHQFINTNDASAAHYVRIAFTVLPGYQQENQYIKALNWNTTLNVRPY